MMPRLKILGQLEIIKGTFKKLKYFYSLKNLLGTGLLSQTELDSPRLL